MVIDFIEVARRAETGPLMLLNDFNRKLIPNTAMKITKEYGLNFNPEVFVNQDNTLADEVWEAGYRFFLETGIYSVSSRRHVKFNEDEIKEVLKHHSYRKEVGYGSDKRYLFTRKVEDSRPPIKVIGPLNADMTIEMMIKLNEGIAREPVADLLYMPGRIRRMDGVEVRMNSAQEIRTVIKYAKACREIIRRAGRPGMPIVGFACTGLNSLAASNEQWGLRTCDPRNSMIVTLGVDDVTWSRLAHFHDYGCPIYITSTPLIGGYAGGPAETALLAIASHIASVVLGGEIIHMGPQHLKYGQQTNAHSLWMTGVVKQAIARNTNMFSITSHTTTGRPGHIQYFYEIAALALNAVTSGSHVCGPRPARPIRNNQVTPLTSRWLGEVSNAGCHLTRKKAQEIVKEIYQKYKDKLEYSKISSGKTFEELYDVDTLTPKEDHTKQYEEVFKDLENMGVPLKSSRTPEG